MDMHEKRAKLQEYLREPGCTPIMCAYDVLSAKLIENAGFPIVYTGSFITGKDAGTLNTGIKIFGDLHEKNKEAYDEIYETEQKIKDDRKCLCICGIRNDSNRACIYSGKSDIQKHSNNSRQRRHLNGSRSRCAEDNHRCDRK